MYYRHILLLSFFLLAPAWEAFAAESSLLVELPVKINESFRRIENAKKSTDQQISSLEPTIEMTVKRIHNSRNDDERYMLQKQYLEQRASILSAITEKVVVVSEELESIIHNMTLLEKASRNSRNYGLGSGISIDDKLAKKTVSETVHGMKNLIEMVESLSPKQNTSNESSTLFNMGMNAQNFFNKGNGIFTSNNIEYLEGALVLSKSAESVLRQEHDHLLEQLYYVDSGNIIRKFGKIKLALQGNNANIYQGITKYRSMDAEVLSTNFSLEDNDEFPEGWDDLGNF